MGGAVTSCGYSASLVQASYNVRCLQDFSDHHGAAKCGKSARCMYECCHYREGLARYFIRCMCCTLAMSARCKDNLAISLQCLHDSTVIMLSLHCCLANILRQLFFLLLLYFKFGSTVPAVLWLRAQIFGIAVRWHFAVGFPRKIVLAPLICDLGISRHLPDSVLCLCLMTL